jgi:hypothetical protein
MKASSPECASGLGAVSKATHETVPAKKFFSRLKV